MMRGVCIFMSLVLCVLGGVHAQNSEVSGDFSVFSANGRYTAVGQITLGADGTGNCNVRVYEMGRVRGQPLWAYEYTVEGEFDPIISDDGSTYVSVCVLYSENKPLVEIFHEGSMTAALTAKDLEIDPARLQQSGPFVLWLSKKKPRYRFLRTKQVPVVLEVLTIDGKRHRIDVSTGGIASN